LSSILTSTPTPHCGQGLLTGGNADTFLAFQDGLFIISPLTSHSADTLLDVTGLERLIRAPHTWVLISRPTASTQHQGERTTAPHILLLLMRPLLTLSIKRLATLTAPKTSGSHTVRTPSPRMGYPVYVLSGYVIAHHPGDKRCSLIYVLRLRSDKTHSTASSGKELTLTTPGVGTRPHHSPWVLIDNLTPYERAFETLSDTARRLPLVVAPMIDAVFA